MQGVDEGAVALNLLFYFPLLAGQSLRRELIVANLLTGYLSECLHDPCFHIIGICLKLVQGY